MTTPTRDITMIEQRLTDASVLHEGVRYVRASVASKIIGIGPGGQTCWIRLGKITPLRFKVPRSSKAPNGVLTAWPLDQTLKAARGYKPMSERRWSVEEDQYLEDRLGKATHQTIGRHLGRSANAVRSRAKQLGITPRSADGLLTTVAAAKLCGVSVQAIRYWIVSGGLPVRHEPAGQKAALIHPANLLDHVRRMPTWQRLTEPQRHRLETIGGTSNGALKGAA
ncbi:hypothetical protein [Algisphaera agarilytica]|uniref:Uncharacterized protein n=1 Tax=Algisphaera agarilytica TaxID=1385975 RepID=A0A7X0LJW3_9BACT|nr:hypothetical protein [Algisphaera agarilytica]MBB6429194.1 hypothetical protein [Algisphaera agarilytica]